MSYASLENVSGALESSHLGNPLEGVFFVFDEDGGEETCPVDEILVFFYPEEGLELDQKLFLQGSISAMAAFAEQFGDGNKVEVLLLKSVKFAVKRVPPFTLATTANVSVGDGELQHFLESLYAAYRFHFGGLNHVAERFCGARAEFLACVQAQLGLLAPMLQAARRRSLLRPFVRLPFLSLPPNCSRFFMAASQYLSRRRREDHVQAGAVFFDSSVLCTHTDIPLTRWIHSRLENLLVERTAASGWQRLGEARAYASASVPSVAQSYASAPNALHGSGERALASSGGDGGPSGGVLATARHSSVAAVTTAARKQCQVFPVFLTFEQLQDIGLKQSRPTGNIPDQYAYVACPPPGGEYVTLVTIFVSRLCATLIMPLQVLFDQEHQDALQQQAEQELAGLSSSVATAFHRNSGSSAGMRDSGNAPSQEFHFLTTDELTGMMRGSVLHKGTPFSEREERFLQGSAFAHELFRSDDISKVLLGDPGGMLYCRNMFSKEVFYMRNGSSMSDVTLEKLEANAQYNLQRHNIQLI